MKHRRFGVLGMTVSICCSMYSGFFSAGIFFLLIFLCCCLFCGVPTPEWVTHSCSHFVGVPAWAQSVLGLLPHSQPPPPKPAHYLQLRCEVTVRQSLGRAWDGADCGVWLSLSELSWRVLVLHWRCPELLCCLPVSVSHSSVLRKYAQACKSPLE